jgi:tRNA modification GTPase
VNLLIAQLLAAGARPAQPGEFTLRAFLNGKLDLPRAEAILAVIAADSRDELKAALAQLAGGISQRLMNLRSDLLDMLAEVEAGLDFAEEDVPEAETKALLIRLAAALAHVTMLGKQLDRRAIDKRPFRVVLAGRPNAGKSSLFNALCGTAAAIVSSEPGTTRDYLIRRIQADGIELELVDAAGRRDASDQIERQAQHLAVDQASAADLVLFCHDVTASDDGESTANDLVIATKCDLGNASIGVLATSAVTGAGIAELRALLAERARQRPPASLVSSVSRCRGHLQGSLQALRRAHHVVLEEEPRELLALELRGALEELGALVGTIYTDDILERIFSRFCIGK